MSTVSAPSDQFGAIAHLGRQDDLAAITWDDFVFVKGGYDPTTGASH